MQFRLRGRMRLRQRLFWTYCASLLVPIALLCVTSFWILRAREIDRLRYACQAALDSALTDVHTVFENVQALAQTLADATWVRKIAYMQTQAVDTTRFDALERKQSVLTLQSNAHSLNALLLAVAFPHKNYVISSSYLHTLDMFLELDARFDCPQAEAWRALIRADRATGVSAPGTLRFLSSVRQAVGYSVFVPLAGASHASTNLIAYFDLKTLQGRMSVPIAADGAHLLVETPDGSVIYAAAADEGAAYEAGAGEWGLWAHGRAIQASKYSQVTGWTFRVFLPQSLVNARLFPLRMALYALLAAFGSVAIGCSWLLAKRRSAPLLRLKQLLGQSGDERAGHGETVYAMLESAVQEVLAERDNQNSLLRQYRPRLRELYLRRLLEEDEASLHPENLALAGIAFPYAHTCCLVIGPSGEAARVLAAHLRVNAERLDIAEYSFEYRQTEVLLLNYNDEEAFTRLTERLEQDPECGIRRAWAGVGRSGDIRSSYVQARNALESRREDNVGPLLYFHDGRPSSPSLPHAMEKQLHNCVQAGDSARAEALLVEALQESAGAKTPLMDAKYRCLNAYFVLSKALTEVGASAPRPMRLEELDSAHSTTALLDHMRPLIHQTCAQCAQAVQEHGTSARYAEIERYIQDHLFDNALSLSAVAEHFGLSGSYISRFIKEHRQETYLDYVNRLRIDKAKQLLKNTNRDINEISAFVGYDSDITFRRVFKKLETITPSQYRVVARINNG